MNCFKRKALTAAILGGLAAAASLGGCAGGLGAQQMSPEQLTAAARDKNASAYCTQITGPWGQGFVLYTNVDKGTVAVGEATIKCGAAEATFKNQPK